MLWVYFRNLSVSLSQLSHLLYTKSEFEKGFFVRNSVQIIALLLPYHLGYLLNSIVCFSVSTGLYLDAE